MVILVIYNVYYVKHNVRGLPKNCSGLHLIPDIVSFFDQSDIVCVQETWYHDIDILHTLHSEYRGTGVSTTDYKDGLVQGHPPGGVAIF